MPILSNFPGGGAKKTVLQIIKEKIIPGKSDQVFTPDEGYDGYGEFTVGAIPDEYQDVSGVTATADSTLEGYSFVNSGGEVVEGEIIDNGDVSGSFDGIEKKSVDIPAGYTSGGTVSLTDDIDNEVIAQEDLLAQIITELEDKAAGTNTSDADADETDIREGKSGYVNGSKINGSVLTRSEADVTFTDNDQVSVPAGIYDTDVLKDIPKNTETWIFTMEDGSTVEKEVEVGV